jgi:hypothetical protein
MNRAEAFFQGLIVHDKTFAQCGKGHICLDPDSLQSWADYFEFKAVLPPSTLPAPEIAAQILEHTDEINAIHQRANERLPRQVYSFFKNNGGPLFKPKPRNK